MDIILSFLAGVILGAVFFGGLYLTVARLDKSEYPAILMLLSLVLRMGVLLGGIYYMSQGDWRRIVSTLAGIMASRFGLIRILKEPKK
jgi:F1F0 ATPase subunit 2